MLLQACTSTGVHAWWFQETPSGYKGKGQKLRNPVSAAGYAGMLREVPAEVVKNCHVVKNRLGGSYL
jgi:hypothetical protein